MTMGMLMILVIATFPPHAVRVSSPRSAPSLHVVVVVLNRPLKFGSGMRVSLTTNSHVVSETNAIVKLYVSPGIRG